MRRFYLFFFNDTATTEIYTLSLHDALPISCIRVLVHRCEPLQILTSNHSCQVRPALVPVRCRRSEEHTSELQSQSNLVCRLLLEKKKISRLSTASCLATHAYAAREHRRCRP